LGSKELGAALLIGVALLLASAGILLLKAKHLTQGERTVGIVVDHKDYHRRASSTMRAPVVRFSAPGGIYDVEGSLSVPRSIYPVDKEVWVLYLPNNPRNAVIFDFVQVFLIPTIVGGLGLVCLTGTAGLMFWTVRRELPGEFTAQEPAPEIPPAPAVQPPAGSAAHEGGKRTEAEVPRHEPSRTCDVGSKCSTLC
jgi:hypothetical protein